MRIVSFNINSIRIRIAELKQLVKIANPDIVCLQETKVDDSMFPKEVIETLGFKHIYFSGQKSYNGVAILSRVMLGNIHSVDFLNSTHKRHISATLEDDTVIHNLYVPAGGDIPDPKLNEKFDFKLRFYDALSAWFSKQTAKNMVLLGDLNVAPLENDVWSHKQLLKIVSHTPVETDALEHLRKTHNWVDAARHFVPPSEKLYSWWSYRNQDWEKSNRGRRLDHIWITPPLLPRLARAYILREARNWPNPSDHVPVIMDLTAE